MRQDEGGSGGIDRVTPDTADINVRIGKPLYQIVAKAVLPHLADDRRLNSETRQSHAHVRRAPARVQLHTLDERQLPSFRQCVYGTPHDIRHQSPHTRYVRHSISSRQVPLILSTSPYVFKFELLVRDDLFGQRGWRQDAELHEQGAGRMRGQQGEQTRQQEREQDPRQPG